MSIGASVAHDTACQHAEGRGTELGTLEAVNVLMRDEGCACTDCDASTVQGH
ncbi:DUF6233 domain-containing protein [Streptomyces shenzhenensis]|uniref:DUF6233 domain-containing protein n=1 Tax=Streptomyces shenzhenensis TaxID=943815 RepID=UPI0033F38051